MNAGQRRWTAADGWMVNRPSPSESHAQLVLVFGARERLKDPTQFAELGLFARPLDKEAAGHAISAERIWVPAGQLISPELSR